MFSKACEYALRATIFLAHNSSAQEKCSVEQVADGIDAPRPFTAKILQQLMRQQVILSVKGPTGGFYLTNALKKQPAWNVLTAFGEDERLRNCVLGLHKCNDQKPCPLHAQYKPIKEQLISLFKEEKIGGLAEAVQSRRIFIRHQ